METKLVFCIANFSLSNKISNHLINNKNSHWTFSNENHFSIFPRFLSMIILKFIKKNFIWGIDYVKYTNVKNNERK